MALALSELGMADKIRGMGGEPASPIARGTRVQSLKKSCSQGKSRLPAGEGQIRVASLPAVTTGTAHF
jgi:hypothetical protein